MAETTINERAQAVAVSAPVPDERVAPLREALRALSAPSAAPAPERAKSRAELLEAIAASSTAAGDELSALAPWRRCLRWRRRLRRVSSSSYSR